MGLSALHILSYGAKSIVSKMNKIKQQKKVLPVTRQNDGNDVNHSVNHSVDGITTVLNGNNKAVQLNSAFR